VAKNGASTELLSSMVDLVHAIDRRGYAFEVCALSCNVSQVELVVAAPLEVSPVEPEVRLVGGFPHVAQLPLPCKGDEGCNEVRIFRGILLFLRELQTFEVSSKSKSKPLCSPMCS
jgi:hypothetical protein